MNFDNKYDPNGKKYEDDDSWAAETNVTYNATERAELTLTLRRAYENSSDALDVNNYIDNLVGFKWVQKLVYQLSLNAYLAYQYWDYQNEAPGLSGKSFDIYTARIGLDWAINDWLKTGLSYRYKTKDASKKIFESDEYTENVVSIYLQAKY